MEKSRKPYKKRKERTPWTDKKEDLLFSIWEEHAYDLKNRKNSHVYSLMEQVFHENHFDDINFFEIKTKIANLLRNYRKEKAKCGGSGSKWKLYDRVHKIIGTRPMKDFYENVNESYIFEGSSMYLSQDLTQGSTTDLTNSDSCLIDVPDAAANVADDTSEEPNKKRKQRTPWTDEKEDLLFSIWEEHAYDLKNRNNSHGVYSLMEKVFHENHFDDINFCEIKTKIDNLKNRYKMEKVKCGGSRSKWKLYDRVHKIRGARHMRDLHEELDESYICEGSSMDLSQDLTQASTTDLINSDSCLLDVPDAVSNVVDDTSQQPNKKRKQRTPWTDEKEDLLLTIWEEQANDLKIRKNSHDIYSLMEKVFHENHFDDINFCEIKTKIANLAKRYKTEKAKCGESRSQWKLYDRVHKIRGARPMRDLHEKVDESCIFEDSSLIDVPDAAANVVVPTSREFIDEEPSSEPAKKKMKVQHENPTLIMKDFATKMLKIERERNQILKKKQETMQEKNNILAKKNELAEERNELLRKILEK